MGAVMDIMPDYIVTSVIMSIHMATCKRGMKKDYAKKAEWLYEFDEEKGYHWMF